MEGSFLVLKRISSSLVEATFGMDGTISAAVFSALPRMFLCFGYSIATGFTLSLSSVSQSLFRDIFCAKCWNDVEGM